MIKTIQPVGVFLIALLTLCGSSSLAGGLEPEPLTLRLNDASGTPGGLVAVVLRTYAARPIRQGQICMSFQLRRQQSPVDKTPSAQLAVTSAMLRGPANGPFATLESAVVFSSADDATQQLQFSPNAAGQPTILAFDSTSASVNASDGPLMVVYYRLSNNVVPGDIYDLTLDAVNTFATDADGQPIMLENRNGQLEIRAPLDPVSVGAAAEAPDIFNSVMLSLQTDEPFAISSGQIGLRYSRDLLPAGPKVRIDPRYGNAQWTIVNIRGLVVVQFFSADMSLNTVPGDIISLYASVNPDADPLTDRSVWLDPAYTFLYDDKGAALSLDLEPDIIP